jgi:tetratricopeptide (TPR) repeat protein
MTKRGPEAVKVLENADSAAGLLMQAKLSLLSEDRDTAAARLLDMLKAGDLQPQQALNAVGLLVPLLADQDRREEARQGLAALRQRFTDNQAVLSRLDQYDVALAYKDPEELDRKLLELITAEPQGLERTRRYFDFYAARGKYDLAQKYLDEMEAASPQDAAVLGNQFTLALRGKNYARAEQYAATLGKMNDGVGADNAGGAVFRAQLALEQNRPDDAVREYRTAQTRLPRSSALQVQLGQALAVANRLDEAVDALREAYDLNPNNFDANVLLDKIYSRPAAADRRPDDWEKHLDQAARLRPRSSYVVENADRVDPQAGIKLREQRRAAEPQDVDNLIRLAQLYIATSKERGIDEKEKTANLAQAEARFNEAVALDPGNPKAVGEAAQFFGSQGKRQQGEKVLAACLEKQNGAQRVSAQVLLARFYKLLADTAAAEQAFAAARQMALDLPDEADKREALLGVELELVNFYRNLPGRARDTITSARWVLDKLNPKDAKDLPRVQFARQAIIYALLDSKQLGDAEKEIDAYLKTFGEDPTLSSYQAQLKLAQRQWQEAYAALTRVLERAPTQYPSLLQRGSLATHLGMSREAIADLTKARELAKAAFERIPAEKRGQSAQARLYAGACAALATVYEIEQQYELGESTLREMVDLLYQSSGPEYAAAQRDAVGRLLRLYERWGRSDKAQQVISEFMARNAEDPFWPAQLALVRSLQGEKYLQQANAAGKLDNRADEKKYRGQAETEYLAAARYYETAQQLAAQQKLPTYLNYLAYELDALAAANRADKAFELFRSVEARVGAEVPAIVHAAMIRVYETAGQRPQALTALEKAIVAAYREGAAAVPAVMGFAGDYLPAEAVAGVIKGLIERVPADGRESFLLHNLLATQLLNMNQPAEVLAAIEPVLAKAPPNSAERLAAMMARQQALLASGQLDAALAVLEDILRLNPDNPVVLNFLAYLLVDEANRPVEALPYAERARELSSSEPNVLDTVGWVYIKNGRNEQAEAALKEALALQPKSPAANYHLGVLYQSTGRTATAREMFARAVECAAKEKNEKIAQKAQEALNALK